MTLAYGRNSGLDFPRLHCTGETCWLPAGHGPVGIVDAIAQSCNAYFAQLATRLGPAALLEVPRLGAWNLHPGPLPRYAGLNAPSWAIYHGERSHGVTVHRMERGIDTGDIAYQDCFPIEETDTGLSLSLRCAERGVGLVQRLLQDAPAIRRRPQDATLRSYFGRAAPQGGRIDWHSPARRIYDFVRACDYGPFPSPWGVPRARLGDDEVEIRKLALTGERCTAAPGTVRGDRVAAADEWLLLHQRAEPKRSGRLSERLGY